MAARNAIISRLLPPPGNLLWQLGWTCTSRESGSFISSYEKLCQKIHITKMRWSGQKHRYGKAGTQIFRGFLTNQSILCGLRQLCHIILLLNSLRPTLKLVRAFYALFLSATLFEHSNMGFFCLLRLQPYAECQLAWSEDNSKAPPRLSVQISDLYLKPHFVENAFWWCLLMHAFLPAELAEGWLDSSALCSWAWALQNSQLAAPTWDQSLPAPIWDQSLLIHTWDQSLPIPNCCWLWFTQGNPSSDRSYGTQLNLSWGKMLI